MTFNYIVKGAAMRKQEKYEAFIKKVSLFDNMDDYEKSQVAEAFEDHFFNSGTPIIKQGDEVTDLFFLLDGKAITVGGGESMEYEEGDFFGDAALL